MKIRIQRIVEEYHQKYNINTEEAKKRVEKEKETERGGSTGNNPTVEKDQSSSKSVTSLVLSKIEIRTSCFEIKSVTCLFFPELI